MGWPEDPRRAEALGKKFEDVVAALEIGDLTRTAGELVGPCPAAGCGGTDRFGINLRKGVFGCRKCGAGGDVIALVRHVRGCGYMEALDWLCGPAQTISPEERQRRDEAAERNRQERQAEAARRRAKAIADARRVWQQGLPAEGTPVRDYLERRGIQPALYPRLAIALRFHPALPYMVDMPTGMRQVHCGPAMLAAVQGPDGRFSAVHRTWLDLGQPRGKAVIRHPDTGAALESKKVLGAKKGGAIRLTPGAGDTLVMGEGIETTLSAAVADQHPGAIYWAGVDLGNMGGSRRLGRGLLYAGLPNLEDGDAFVPPPWVRRLIYVMDGDSEPRLTRAKLEAGLRRAMLLRPGLTGFIAAAPPGRDLNDLVMDGGDDEQDEDEEG